MYENWWWWWWWLQHPTSSKDDEACAISGKRTTSNSKLNTVRYFHSGRGQGVRRGADFLYEYEAGKLYGRFEVLCQCTSTEHGGPNTVF